MSVVTISAIGARGDGLVKGEGGTRFVPFTLPNETVRIAGEGPRLDPIEIIQPSPERVQAECPHFTDCGGCALQHWALQPYLNWKRTLVVEALAHAGFTTDVRQIIDGHGRGRRRATFHARKGADGYKVGFNAARDHRVVALHECLLLAPEMEGALDFARLLTDRLSGSGTPIDYQMTATLNGLDIDIRGVPEKFRPADKTMIALVTRPGLARLTWNGALILQRAEPLVMIGESKVNLPPAAFLQATEQGQQCITDLVLEAAGPKAGAMLDLFCGVGTFTLPLAKLGKVHGADSSAEAIAALKDAARFLTKVKPITAEARDLFRRPFLPMDLKTIDTVVFDPPRAGAEAQVKQLAKSNVSRVVAVSCNLTSFMADVKVLAEAGFKVRHITPVDQFRYSGHVELVALLER